MTQHPFISRRRRYELPLPRTPPLGHHQPSRHLLILIVALFSSRLSLYKLPCARIERMPSHRASAATFASLTEAAPSSGNSRNRACPRLLTDDGLPFFASLARSFSSARSRSRASLRARFADQVATSRSPSWSSTLSMCAGAAPGSGPGPVPPHGSQPAGSRIRSRSAADAERCQGGVHDQPDREPGQLAAQGGPSAGPFPRGRRGEEAAVPGASRHRGPVEGAAGLLAGGESRVRDPVWRTIQDPGPVGTGGGMAAPRRVSGAGFSGLRCAPASEAGSGYAPNPMVRSGLEAGSGMPENRYAHPVENGGPFTTKGGPDT